MAYFSNKGPNTPGQLEFLEVNYFNNFSEAYERTHAFIRFYSEARIHGSIGDIAPAEGMVRLKRGETLNIKTISMWQNCPEKRGWRGDMAEGFPLSIDRQS